MPMQVEIKEKLPDIATVEWAWDDSGENSPVANIQLAVLGAPPAFRETLHVGRPNVTNRAGFLARIVAMLDSGRLTNHGPLVTEFETRVAEIAKTRHCIAVSNGTTALELAIAALDMRGEVIVPSFTFVATVHALRRQGIRPVFCDVDPDTHCLDPNAVEAAITSETSGILAVSLWGNLGEWERLHEIARRRGLRLLYDAAHAFGCAPLGGATADWCDAEVYSFHATKCVQAIEGGAILTHDDALASKLRLMSNFGFDAEDTVEHLGTNGKMNEAEAAMGLTSLESMGVIFAHNRANTHDYTERLAKVNGLRLLQHGDNQCHNYQYVVVEVDADEAGLSRDDIVAALRLENVVARRYFHPGVHQAEPYRSEQPRAGADLPVTKSLTERVMVLPNGLSIGSREVHLLTERIRTIVAHAPAVRDALSRCRDERLGVFLCHTVQGSRNSR